MVIYYCEAVKTKVRPQVPSIACTCTAKLMCMQYCNTNAKYLFPHLKMQTIVATVKQLKFGCNPCPGLLRDIPCIKTL